MFKLAELFVEVGAVTKPLDNALASVKGRIAALAATRFNIPGGGFAALLGLGGGAIALNKAIQGASTLAETIDKTRRIFGQSADLIIKKSDEMAEKFGVEKTEYLNAAAGFGAVFKGIGKSQEDAAKLGNELALLALDMANFDSTTRGEAFGAISSALRGEMDPIERFRVFLNEDKVAAEALAMGLVKTKGQIDDTSKKMAVMNLILKQTRDAHGNLEATSQGAFAQNQKFWGSLDNLSRTVGTALLPAFTALVTLLNEVAHDMQESADSSQGAWSGFLKGFEAIIDTAGVIYRNFGDIVERTTVMIGGYMANLWEGMTYGNKVVIANVDAMIKSLTTGRKFEFQLPRLEFSDVGNQIAEIDRRIDARNKKRQDEIDARRARGLPGNGEVKGGPPGNGVAPSNQKYGITDIETYLKELQESSTGGRDEIARAQLRALEQIARNTEEARDKANKAGPAPVGARWG